MTEISNPNDPVEHLLGMRNLAQAWAGDSSAGTSLQMLAIQAAYAAADMALCMRLMTQESDERMKQLIEALKHRK
jgi:hypothetical protein